MKKYRLIQICLSLLFILAAPTVQAQHHDRHAAKQWKAMEKGPWSFSPDYYYYSFVKRKILGITFRIPSAGIHDNGFGGTGIGGDHYVDQRWRQMTPLRLTQVASLLVEYAQTDTIRKRWNEETARNIKEIIDKKTDLGKNIESLKIRDLFNQISMVHENLPERMRGKIADEYRRIERNIRIIGQSYTSNADKILAYRRQVENLKRLHNVSKALWIMHKSKEIIHSSKDAELQESNDWLDMTFK